MKEPGEYWSRWKPVDTGPFGPSLFGRYRFNFKPAYFGHRNNHVKALCFMALARHTRAISLCELAKATQTNYHSLAVMLPRWVRWHYVNRYGDYGAYRYRLSRRGKRFLQYVPDLLREAIGERLTEIAVANFRAYQKEHENDE